MKKQLTTIATLSAAALAANPVQAEELINDFAESTAETSSTETVAEDGAEETIVNAPVAKEAEYSQTGTAVEVTSMELKTAEGGDKVTTFENIETKLEFSVADGVKDGDTATIAVPEALKFTDETEQTIDLHTPQNETFAAAKYQPKQNNVVLTFNKVAEDLQNIRGGLMLNLRLNWENLEIGQTVPVAFTVDGKTAVTKNLTYVGVGQQTKRNFEKASWQTSDPTILRTQINYGKLEAGLTNVSLRDDILADSEDNLDYTKESLKVYTGSWGFDPKTGDFMTDVVNVTDQVTVTWSDTDKSFVIDFGNLADNKGFRVTYDSKIIAGVTDGETLDNRAYIFADKQEIGYYTARTAIRNQSGWIIGDNKPAKETKIPNNYPTIEIPEAHLDQRVPNDFPTVEVPEAHLEHKVPNDFPTVEVPEAHLEHKVPNDYPTHEVPEAVIEEEKPSVQTEKVVIKGKTVEVPKPTEAKVATIKNAKLPETGDKENRETGIIVALLAVIWGCLLAYHVKASDDRKEK